MDHRWFSLIAIPALLCGGVLLLAPPVPLSTEEDYIKAQRLLKQQVKPEPIPIPPEEAKATTRDSKVRPAVPRTQSELAQIRSLLKAREETLLQRKAKLPAYDTSARTALYADIMAYNEDLTAFDVAAAALRN